MSKRNTVSYFEATCPTVSAQIVRATESSRGRTGLLQTCSHEGRAHVSHLLSKFKHKGPNGEHVCLVFDVLGHHLGFQTVKYEDGRLPVKTVKLIAKQLLLGLDFLHRECGIIHTGMT